MFFSVCVQLRLSCQLHQYFDYFSICCFCLCTLFNLMFWTVLGCLGTLNLQLQLPFTVSCSGRTLAKDPGSSVQEWMVRIRSFSSPRTWLGPMDWPSTTSGAASTGLMPDTKSLRAATLTAETERLVDRTVCMCMLVCRRVCVGANECMWVCICVCVCAWVSVCKSIDQCKWV